MNNTPRAQLNGTAEVFLTKNRTHKEMKPCLASKEASRQAAARMGIDVKNAPRETAEALASLSDLDLQPPERPSPLLQVSREVTIRFRGRALSSGPLTEPKGVAELARKVIRDESKEHFLAFYLDGANGILGHSIVSIGTASEAIVHPREVFQPALLLGAVSLIVAHNHPSGSIRPSPSDWNVIERLADVAKLLSIRFLDSVIVTRGAEFSSMRDERPNLFRQGRDPYFTS